MKNKVIKIIAASCLLISSCAALGSVSVLKKQPFITLDVSFAGCSYIPKVNGVDFSDVWGGDSGVLNTTIPVNQWLKSGKNNFSLEIFPVEDATKIRTMGQKCKATVILQTQELGSNNKPTQLAKYEYTSEADHIIADKKNFLGTTTETQLNSNKNFEQVDKGGDIKIGPIHIQKIETKNGPGVKISRTIDLPLPFPKWAWFDGETIQNNEQTKASLFKEYQKIWEALKTKNAGALAPMFHQRIKEYSEAFYVPFEKMNVIKQLEEVTKNPEYQLVELIPKYEYLQVFGNGKLARLVSWDHITPIIVFNEEDMHSSYDIIFMKKNDKWEIIR